MSSTSLLTGAMPGSPTPLLGDQRPRLLSLPAGVTSFAAGEDAVELCTASGLFLDDWQQFILVNGMSEVSAAKWAAYEVMLVVSRQNGKNGVALGRQLAGLFTVRESLIIHTAHKFAASAEHYRKIRDIIKANDSLARRVKRNGFHESHGAEGIELRATPTIIMGSESRLVRQSVSPRLLFHARAPGSSRSFTCDCLFWDEDMYLSDDDVGAAQPALAAVPNPQLWYLGSAGTRQSAVKARVRRRAMKAIAAAVKANGGRPSAGVSPWLLFAEWSIDHCVAACPRNCARHDDPHDRRSFAKANPGLGIRLTEEKTAKEMESMAPNGVRVWPPDQFARERLGVGDYPEDEEGWLVISESDWTAGADAGADRPQPRIALVGDVSPNQRSAAIAIAGWLPDGRILYEIPLGDDGLPDHRQGVSWLVPRLAELRKAHRPCAIVMDAHSPAAPLIAEAEAAGMKIVKPTASDAAAAFGLFNTRTATPGETPGTRQLAHLRQPEIAGALAGATTRDVGDGGKAWARKTTETDICPLVAATYAVWAADKFGRRYNVLNSVAGPS